MFFVGFTVTILTCLPIGYQELSKVIFIPPNLNFIRGRISTVWLEHCQTLTKSHPQIFHSPTYPNILFRDKDIPVHRYCD